MLVMELVVDSGEKRYVADCLHSSYQKVQFYLQDTEELIRSLSEFCLTHFRTMHQTHKVVRMTDMYAKVRKKKTLQQ